MRPFKKAERKEWKDLNKSSLAETPMACLQYAEEENILSGQIAAGNVRKVKVPLRDC